MKQKRIQYLKTFILLIILFPVYGCECGSKAQIYNNNANIPYDITGYGVDPILPYTEPQTHVYYLDAVNGNDSSGHGTSASPWQTLLKVRGVMVSGDTVILRDGDYGYYTEESASRTDWITFKADTGATPVLKAIVIYYNSMSDAYLRFDGIDIQTSEYSSSGGTNQNGVYIYHARYVEIRNCQVHYRINTNKYIIGSGIYISNSENVLAYHNHIHTSMTGVVTLNSKNITICGNHIHHLGGGTGIQDAQGCENIIIERNNIYDSNWDPADTGAPGAGDAPHGSGVSITSSNIWVKQNIVHDAGSTAGIRFYEGSVRSNILVENNLLDDIHNGSNGCMSMNQIGTHIIIRNNTFIGFVRTDDVTDPGKLYNGLNAEEIAAGYDGSGLKAYNNIIVGTAVLPGKAVISNNIFWSFYYFEHQWQFLSSLAGNKIIVSSGSNFSSVVTYFTTGFFTGITAESEFASGYSKSHILDFSLASGSEAINFGDADNQPSESLGTLDAGGFIQDDGAIRDSLHHSAGCYEY